MNPRTPLRAGIATCTVAAAILATTAWSAPKEVGLNVHQSADVGLDVTKDLRGVWVRMDFNWYNAEPSQGAIDFSLYDQIVDNALGRGLKVLAVIGYTPAWASSGNGDGADTLNDVPVPGTYGAFVSAAAQHFQGRVTHWELWNEPNLDTFFEGTPQQYVDLVLVPGANAIHAVCPDCVVVAPGLATVGGEWDVWMQTVFTQAADKVDIVSGHVYARFPQDDPSAGQSDPSFYSKLEDHRVKKIGDTVVYEDPLSLRECMVRYGVASKPFWLTETGAEAAYGDSAAMLRQARYVRHVLEAMLTRPWWTTTIFYEAFDEPSSGYEWGFVLHDPSAPSGYRCKTVCDVVRRAIRQQPAFGGDGSDCSDGLDNDGDELIDYPADTDCTSVSSTSEGQPPADGGMDDASADGPASQSDAGALAAEGVSNASSGCACGASGADARQVYLSWGVMMLGAAWTGLRRRRQTGQQSNGGERRRRSAGRSAAPSIAPVRASGATGSRPSGHSSRRWQHPPRDGLDAIAVRDTTYRSVDFRRGAPCSSLRFRSSVPIEPAGS
jgi:MYXO-CTERM domain-containing protein